MQPRSTRFNKVTRHSVKFNSRGAQLHAGGPTPDATGLSAGSQWALVGSWWPVPALLPNFPAPNWPRRAVQGAGRAPGGSFLPALEPTTTTKRALGQWRFAVGNRSGGTLTAITDCITVCGCQVSFMDGLLHAGHRSEGDIGIFRGKSKRCRYCMSFGRSIQATTGRIARKL